MGENRARPPRDAESSSIDATRDVFDRTAPTYDPARRALIPCFDQLYGTAVALLPGHTDRVLDLGAGTGLLSAFVRKRFPDARLHLIDNAPAMLRQARERFSRDGEVLCQAGDYTSCEWGGSYDAVVSALSIHHLSDDAKQRLFRRILPALRPGGVFVNAEQILAPNPELEAEARQRWLEQAGALGATAQQIRDSLLRQAEDRCATIADQLQWLSGAGFTDARCAFHSGRFAVLTAVRPIEAPCAG